MITTQNNCDGHLLDYFITKKRCSVPTTCHFLGAIAVSLIRLLEGYLVETIRYPANSPTPIVVSTMPGVIHGCSLNQSPILSIRDLGSSGGGGPVGEEEFRMDRGVLHGTREGKRSQEGRSKLCLSIISL